MYKTEYNKKLSLKCGSAEWFNSDCPAIYADDGTMIVKNTLYGFVWDEWETCLKKSEIAKFVIKSYHAFCRKYGYEIKSEWAKNDKLFTQ